MPGEENDNPQLSLGEIITNLPAVRAARKVNTMSRVHRRLIEPVELTEQDNELAFQHSVFCQTSLPYRNPGDDIRGSRNGRAKSDDSALSLSGVSLLASCKPLG